MWKRNVRDCASPPASTLRSVKLRGDGSSPSAQRTIQSAAVIVPVPFFTPAANSVGFTFAANSG